MKIPSLIQLRLATLASVLLASGQWAAIQADDLTPTAVGDAAVAAAIGARPNLALASGGGVAFSSSDLGANYSAPDVNDGIIDGSGFSWIHAAADTTPFVAVALPVPAFVGSIVFQGQSGYNGRSHSTWSIQYTTDASPDAGSTWVEYGTYTYVEPTCAEPMPRTLFDVPPAANVTAIRLVPSLGECTPEKAVQELEVYEPASVMLAPSAIGEPDVTSAIAGRVNQALASGGGVAFASSDLGANFGAANVNDGIIDDSGFSWIHATADLTPFVAVTLPAPVNMGSLVLQGQTGYNGRSHSTWSIQYTADPSPSAGSAWIELGTYTYSELPGCATPMPRTLFNFPTVTGVTAVRLLPSLGECTPEKALQELEVYEELLLPPSITSQPTGGTFVEGDYVVLSVTATGADYFQWRKDGVDVPDATGSSYVLSNLGLGDAGDYDVVVGNANGLATSDLATIVVTPAPVFNSYPEAVFTDNPIHYYPLDETSGTVAADLGSLALAGGTYTGGYTLGEPSPQPDLGTCARFDGQDGTLVDLGLFHPGDNVTIEAWARLEVDARPASFHAIVARWDGSYELDIDNTELANLVIRNDANAFGVAEGAAPITRGVWHHLVGIFSGGVVSIFVDGVKGTEQNIGGVLQDAGPERVMIGATREGILGFKGWIDEVAIYDYALSPVQVRNHYRTALNKEEITLDIGRAVIVSWPTFPAGIVLQSSTNIDGPYSNATGTVYYENNKAKMAIPTDDTVQKFYQILIP